MDIQAAIQSGVWSAGLMTSVTAFEQSGDLRAAFSSTRVQRIVLRRDDEGILCVVLETDARKPRNEHGATKVYKLAMFRRNATECVVAVKLQHRSGGIEYLATEEWNIFGKFLEIFLRKVGTDCFTVAYADRDAMLVERQETYLVVRSESGGEFVAGDISGRLDDFVFLSDRRRVQVIARGQMGFAPIANLERTLREGRSALVACSAILSVNDNATLIRMPNVVDRVLSAYIRHDGKIVVLDPDSMVILDDSVSTLGDFVTGVREHGAFVRIRRPRPKVDVLECLRSTLSDVFGGRRLARMSAPPAP